ncbi:hypothetical protein M0813_09175 [Anaeramoeba flamelloides]|uniref:Macro domain-containing protein n=1 Tax=Anaeramoeba flamelloides TaxID=1746091 RepID=A0ABQ8X633_9EUKA|nr:hypothetical protein M0813_09175 [Anaeramoeba flamelloides]
MNENEKEKEKEKNEEQEQEQEKVKKEEQEEIECLKYEEIEGDLFTSEDSLAHCVSADLGMGKGIAKIFKTKYGGIQDYKKQSIKIGGSGFIKRNGKFIIILVTKNRYFHKPSYESLEKSLCAMKKICIEKKIKSLSMPKIGCGLDRLEWNRVSELIKKTFGDLNIAITIYFFNN